jgi:hypothetical protein
MPSRVTLIRPHHSPITQGLCSLLAEVPTGDMKAAHNMLSERFYAVIPPDYLYSFGRVQSPAVRSLFPAAEVLRVLISRPAKDGLIQCATHLYVYAQGKSWNVLPVSRPHSRASRAGFYARF